MDSKIFMVYISISYVRFDVHISKTTFLKIKGIRLNQVIQKTGSEAKLSKSIISEKIIDLPLNSQLLA